ncbi:MAG: hypothetical protein V7711_17900 [Pseudomonadales bacterium]
MLMLEYKAIGWRYWVIIGLLLLAAMLFNQQLLLAAIAVTVIHLLHFMVRDKDITSFPVQVRFFFLLLLLAAQPQSMRWLYWLPTIGVWLQILFGYCLMARAVSLLPWNRQQPLTMAMLKNTFFSRPVRGSVKQGFAAI